jgi:hypothetical protein
MTPAEYWRSVEQRAARGERRDARPLSDVRVAYWAAVDARTGGRR